MNYAVNVVEKPGENAGAYQFQGFTDGFHIIDAAAVVVPGEDLAVVDKNPLGVRVAPIDIAEHLFGRVGETVDISRVGRGLDAEDGADLLGFLLEDLPPGEGVLCQGVLFYQDAVTDGQLLAAIGNEDEGAIEDHVLGQLR